MYFSSDKLTMVQTSSLSYAYKSGPKLDFPDITLNASESCLVLGQSGVGKTTFLHLLAGLMTPTSGKVIIGDTDITKLRGDKLDTFRGKSIGIIFQKNHFVNALSVMENLTLAQKLAGNPVDKRFAQSLLDQLNIGEYGNKATNQLSEGEKQRVSIARALVNKPILILADEPSSALDDDNCNDVISLLNESSQKINASLIIVTHDNRLKSTIDKQVLLVKENAHA